MKVFYVIDFIELALLKNHWAYLSHRKQKLPTMGAYYVSLQG